MKLYYHINLTGKHDQADLLSIGLVTGNGISAYLEINDYDDRKVDKRAAEIISDFLGRDGMDDLIVGRKKSKGYICSGRQAKEHINSLIADHQEVGLVGYASIYEAAAMVQMFNDANFAKHVHLVNLEPQLAAQNKGLLEEVAPELPASNALRRALFYKEISNRYGTNS